MKETRQDAWTREEDLLLAETVLQYIKNGNTQLEAFKAVASKLVRTPAACGFRWNATIRKQYESAIKQAKEERKRVSSQALLELQEENSNDADTIESAIQLLEKMKTNVSDEDKRFYQEREEMVKQLQVENKQLLHQIDRYKTTWTEMGKLWNWVDSMKEKNLNE